MSAFSPPPQSKPSGYQPAGPNYFTSVQVQPNQQQSVGTPGSTVTSPAAGQGGVAGKKAGGGDAFSALLAGSNIKKTGSPAQKGLTMADMAKQKSQMGLYGAPAATLQQPAVRNQAKPSTGSSGLDDLLG